MFQLCLSDQEVDNYNFGLIDPVILLLQEWMYFDSYFRLS